MSNKNSMGSLFRRLNQIEGRISELESKVDVLDSQTKKKGKNNGVEMKHTRTLGYY
jgi:hypothetical protein